MVKDELRQNYKYIIYMNKYIKPNRVESDQRREAILHVMVRVIFSEKVTFQQTSEGKEKGG